jgi:hypothetical protein
MLQLARAIVGVVSDILSLGVLFLRSSGAIRAENLVLRRQLGRYIERDIKPRRVDHATRVSLALRLAAGALVLAKLVLGGLHHWYSIATASASA